MRRECQSSANKTAFIHARHADCASLRSFPFTPTSSCRGGRDERRRTRIDNREAGFAQVVLAPEAVVAASDRSLMSIELHQIGTGLRECLGCLHSEPDRTARPPWRDRKLA